MKRPAASGNARMIRRTVILVILAVIAVYTAVFTTLDKVSVYYRRDQSTFWYFQHDQNSFHWWIPVFIAAGALVVYALFSLISRRVKNKEEAEAKHMEELMDTPLKKFSDREDRAEKLANNYNGDPGNDVKQ
jgi:H+/Cl- antiporter ClcA